MNYIAVGHRDRAMQFGATILRTTSQIGRPGRIAGTREAVVHPNYLLINRATGTVKILAVLHARQRYP